MNRISWDDLFLQMARLVALRSPDTSTRLGAVIVSPDNRVLSTGYNGWPRGVTPFTEDDPRWERPRKYSWMAHAERNAIDNACCAGVPLFGATLYSTITPCADCARGIIQAGVRNLVIDKKLDDLYRDGIPNNNTWWATTEDTFQMFYESQVTYRWHETSDLDFTVTLGGTVHSL